MCKYQIDPNRPKALECQNMPKVFFKAMSKQKVSLSHSSKTETLMSHFSPLGAEGDHLSDAERSAGRAHDDLCDHALSQWNLGDGGASRVFAVCRSEFRGDP